MKKILLSAFCAFGLFSLAHAQAPCTPDAAALDNSVGIVPDTTTNFAKGCLNQPYSQLISVRVPTDTIEPNTNMPVQINYVEIVEVNNLPPGFDYACSTSDCKFAGGTDGCAIVTGPADQLGTWQLNVKLNANIKVALGPITQDIDNAMDDVDGWKIIIEDCEDVSTINPDNLASFKVYPNPATDKVMIADLADNGITKTIKVMNTAGQLIGEMTTVNDMVVFETANLNAGIYFVQVEQNNEKEVVKLIIE